MKIDYNTIIESITDGSGNYKSTAFLNEKQIVRATLRRCGKKLPRWNENKEIILTVGRPNYAERDMIKQFKKNKVAFPILLLKVPKKI